MLRRLGLELNEQFYASLRDSYTIVIEEPESEDEAALVPERDPLGARKDQATYDARAKAAAPSEEGRLGWSKKPSLGEGHLLSEIV